MMGFDLKVSENLTKLLSLVVSDKKGTLYNETDYILKLEYGSSTQAPEGMIRKHIPEFEDKFKGNIIEAVINTFLDGNPVDFNDHLSDAIDDTLKDMHKTVALDTPVKTGNARNNWISQLNNGTEYKSSDLGVGV